MKSGSMLNIFNFFTSLTFIQVSVLILLAILILAGFICIAIPSKRKAGVTIFRIIVGLLFIFSGFVKADDPLGFTYKMQEYFAKDALNFPFMDKFSFAIAFTVPIIEMTLGLMIIIGTRKLLTLTLIMAMMIFFTFLTWYTAHYHKVLECGCFGDAIPFTSWQSFWKNVVLMVFICIILIGYKYITPIFTKGFQNILVLLFLAGSTLFSWYCYAYLPVIDFRPYKIGTDIKKAMKGVPGVDKYYYNYKNKSTGEEKEFEVMKMGADTNTWKLLNYRTETIKKGIDPVDFNISAISGEDVTDSILSIPGNKFLLVSMHLNEAANNTELVKKINDLASDCSKNHISFICLTNSGEEDITAFQKKFDPTYKFFNADEIVLKTMIRSNPGLILLKGGVVKAMWHYHSMPSYSEVSEKYFH